MLAHLSISNFAIVDQLDLDIPKGMTVITGETGAGKSIMLDALSLTLGARAGADCVRLGHERADIRATFDLTELPAASRWLSDRDLDADGECILRRVITSEGRSRGYINGSTSPLSDLRELGELLIDIHAQHEHQSLLRPVTHQRLLDDFVGCAKLTGQLQDCWKEWKNLQNQIHTLKNRSQELQARQQLLEYQVDELDQLGLAEGEIEQLEQEQKQLANADASLHTCQQVVDLCSENDASNILHTLSTCQNLITNLNMELPALQNTQELLANARIQVEEAVGELNHFVDSFEADPERLNEVSERLSTAYTLARKHHVPAEELHTLHISLQEELQTILHSDEAIEDMEQQLAEHQARYLKLAEKLSGKRLKGATQLNKKVSHHIHDLGMPAGQFIVELSPLEGEPQPLGMEAIRFLVSTNPGMPPKSLEKVASGGELSRISLAIQVITAATSQIPTLVFDEVDVGIGGGTAEIVGKLLRTLGEKGQVLCVTHQPQVASQGHTHLHVSKHLKKNSTSTSIQPLTGKKRTLEVARMLGGLEMTEQTLAHAEEMITRTAPA